MPNTAAIDSTLTAMITPALFMTATGSLIIYLAMAFFVGTSLTTAFHVLIGSDVMALPTELAIAGVSLLLLVSVQLTREAHAALRENRVEIEFYDKLRRWRASA